MFLLKIVEHIVNTTFRIAETLAPARIPVAAGKKTPKTVKNDWLLENFGGILARKVVPKTYIII